MKDFGVNGREESPSELTGGHMQRRRLCKRFKEMTHTSSDSRYCPFCLGKGYTKSTSKCKSRRLLYLEDKLRRITRPDPKWLKTLMDRERMDRETEGGWVYAGQGIYKRP